MTKQQFHIALYSIIFNEKHLYIYRKLNKKPSEYPTLKGIILVTTCNYSTRNSKQLKAHL